MTSLCHVMWWEASECWEGSKEAGRCQRKTERNSSSEHSVFCSFDYHICYSCEHIEHLKITQEITNNMKQQQEITPSKNINLATGGSISTAEETIKTKITVAHVSTLVIFWINMFCVFMPRNWMTKSDFYMFLHLNILLLFIDLHNFVLRVTQIAGIWSICRNSKKWHHNKQK